MPKSRQLGLRLEDADEIALTRVAQREGRNPLDVIRDSIRTYVRKSDEQQAFITSVERGWYELSCGVGEEVTEEDEFLQSLRRELESEDVAS